MNIEAIVKELEDVAGDMQSVKDKSPAQRALLLGVAAVKMLQGRILIQEAEALFFSLSKPEVKK